MSGLTRTRWTRFAGATTLPLVLLLAATGCTEEEMDDEFPEAATIEEVEPMEELGERIEYDDETLITEGDVGEPIIATGWVVGTAATGFLLRTDNNRVIFVETQDQVQMGDAVEASGIISEVEVTMLEDVEREMFGDTGFEMEWEVEEVYYIDSATVEPVTPTM